MRTRARRRVVVSNMGNLFMKKSLILSLHILYQSQRRLFNISIIKLYEKGAPRELRKAKFDKKRKEKQREVN